MVPSYHFTSDPELKVTVLKQSVYFGQLRYDVPWTLIFMLFHFIFKRGYGGWKMRGEEELYDWSVWEIDMLTSVLLFIFAPKINIERCLFVCLVNLCCTNRFGEKSLTFFHPQLKPYLPHHSLSLPGLELTLEWLQVMQHFQEDFLPILRWLNNKHTNIINNKKTKTLWLILSEG